MNELVTSWSPPVLSSSTYVWLVWVSNVANLQQDNDAEAILARNRRPKLGLVSLSSS